MAWLDGVGRQFQILVQHGRSLKLYEFGLSPDSRLAMTSDDGDGEGFQTFEVCWRWLLF